MAIFSEIPKLSNEDLRKLRSLRAGMTVDLQITISNVARRVRTEFIGMDGMRSIIIRYPDETKWTGLNEAIYPDKPAIMRFILEDETGEVIAFKTKVTHLVKKPVNMIFIAFPVEIQRQELRSERRAQIRMPVSVLNAENEQMLANGILLDISNSGCRIGTQRDAAKKLAVKDIVIRMNGQQGEPFELKGTVMNIKSDEVYFLYGVKFTISEVEVENLMGRLMIEP